MRLWIASTRYARGRCAAHLAPPSAARRGPPLRATPPLFLVTFPVPIPANFTREEIVGHLARQGYTRVRPAGEGALEVVQDRVPPTPENRGRLVDALEAALRVGGGRVALVPVAADGSDGEPRRFSADLHCPRLRPPLRGPDAEPLLLQLPDRRLPDLPGLRPHDRHRLRLVIPDESLTLRGGRDPPLAERHLARVPGRPRAPRQEARHPARRALARADRRAAALGHRGRGGVGEGRLVRRAPLLRVARVQGLQDAHPRAALQVPLLQHLPGLRRRAPEARGAALAARDERLNLHELTLLPDLAVPRLLRRARAARPLDEAADLLLARDPHPPRATWSTSASAT